jgi:cell wall-associated NlpC family hydrolase
LSLAFAEPAAAQRAVDAQIGTWNISGSNPVYYSAALWRRALGPVGTAVRGLGLSAGDTAGRSLFGVGLDVTLFRGEGRLVPYGIAGTGFAIEYGGSSGTAALWNAGFGLELNPASWIGLALEARKLAEDRRLRGFWNLESDDRQGWLYAMRGSIRFESRSYGRRASSASRVEPREPPPWLTAEVGAAGGAAEPLSAEGLTRATQIAETALAAMGEPYRWGGTQSEGGFDCSGLIFYAYTTHGVSVPRVSRDQAHVGRYVVPDEALLQPGDILLFANRRDAVTHVGLYIGNAKFIHATTSGGVRVGALDPSASDENDRWWIQRWVGARRILR